MEDHIYIDHQKALFGVLDGH